MPGLGYPFATRLTWYCLTWLLISCTHSQVTSPHGTRMHFQENTESGQFHFKAPESGNFMACFWASNSPVSVIHTVELDWKTGVAAKDWDVIAKKEKVDVCVFSHVIVDS